MINALFTISPKKYARNKIQEKTLDRFRLRWNNYKESDNKFLRGEEIKQYFCMSTF